MQGGLGLEANHRVTALIDRAFVEGLLDLT